MSNPDTSAHQPEKAFSTETERYAAFLRHTDQKINATEAILQKIDHSELLASRIADENYPLTIVYIGVGNGSLEIPLTQQIIARRNGSGQNVGVFCEDPSSELRDQFYLAASAHGIPTIQGYSLKSFEDPSYTPQSADLITASHSAAYFVEDWVSGNPDPSTSSLSKFAQAVQPGGLGLIILQSDQSDGYKMRQTLLTDEAPRSRTGGQVVSTLEKLGVKPAVEVIESELDMSSCFQENGSVELTDEGILLLEFILNKSWKDLNENQQELVRQRLSEIATVTPDNKHVLLFRDTFIWIMGS